VALVVKRSQTLLDGERAAVWVMLQRMTSMLDGQVGRRGGRAATARMPS